MLYTRRDLCTIAEVGYLLITWCDGVGRSRLNKEGRILLSHHVGGGIYGVLQNSLVYGNVQSAGVVSCALATKQISCSVAKLTASACPGADIHSETKMMKGRPEI